LKWFLRCLKSQKGNIILENVKITTVVEQSLKQYIKAWVPEEFYFKWLPMCFYIRKEIKYNYKRSKIIGVHIRFPVY